MGTHGKVGSRNEQLTQRLSLEAALAMELILQQPARNEGQSYKHELKSIWYSLQLVKTVGRFFPQIRIRWFVGRYQTGTANDLAHFGQ